MDARGRSRRLLGTTEAAERLGVSTNRVGELVRRGTLPATRVGRTWVIDEDSVEKLAARGPGGRIQPLTSAEAWAVAYLIDGLTPQWISAVEQRRLARRVEIKRSADGDAWAAWLGCRAVRTVRVWVHPTHSDAFARRLLRRGNEDVPSDLKVEDGDLLAWASHAKIANLLQDPVVLASSRPNTVVRLWPHEIGEVVEIPRVIAAADLLDEPDSRSRRVGRWILSRALGVP